MARFNDLYEIDLANLLGAGSFSEVYSGYVKSAKPSGQQEVAIKCTDKTKLTDVAYRALTLEVQILNELRDNPHVIELYDVFNEVDSPYVYQILEKVDGGELFDRVVQQEFLHEKDVWEIARILLSALDYMHNKGIAHRDLKPDNLLLVCEDRNLIKLADFGFAKHCTDNLYTGRGNLTTMCGTPTYVAPDILSRKPYGTMIDMWSAGIIIYILLAGYPPFVESNQRDLFKKIQTGSYEFDEEYWSHVSDDAKHLIMGLLVVDPKDRMNARQGLETNWIRNGEYEAEILENRMLPKTLPRLRKFNAIRKVRAAVHSVLAVEKFTSILCGDLRIIDVNKRDRNT